MDHIEEGQIAAFVEELTQHQRKLYRYIYKFVHNPQQTDDLLQQTNVVLWEKYKTYRIETDFFAWASRVAFFEVRKYVQSQGQQPLFLDESLLSQIEARQTARDDLHTLHSLALLACIEKLTPVNRELIKLCYDGEHSIVQVAGQLERPVGSIYTLLGRIRRKLWECIQQALMEGSDL